MLVLMASAPVAAQQTSSAYPVPETGGAGEPSGGAEAPETADSELQAMAADTDPTKPVFFSLREEFYDLGRGLWRNVAIIRMDKAVLERSKLPGQARGFLLRADLPVVSFYNGAETETGLGDLYGQALFAPRIRGPVFLAVGTGLIVPTASGDSTGLGKWVAAPVVVPVIFFPRRGLGYVKIQDWISISGLSGRPDVHYLTITPTVLWRLWRRWWILIDEESLTDWEKGSETSYKGGVLLGLMLSRRAGVSLKTEIPFGAHRRGDWTVKAIFFWTRY
jgi:hypothetical protein